MAQLITVRLTRGDAQPWGFRLQGGKDFGTPLLVQKVNSGSLADQVGLVAGDAVIKINGQEVHELRHKDAQDVVVRAGNNVEMSVQRGGSTWKPNVSLTGSIPFPNQHGGISPVTKTSLAHKTPDGRPISAIGTGYNNAARPFNSGVKSIVNNQYNTPVGIYSDESIAETLSAQAEVLAGGVLGVNFKKNEKIYNSANSEVYKMLQEQDNEPEDQGGSCFGKGWAEDSIDHTVAHHPQQTRPLPHVPSHVPHHVPQQTHHVTSPQQHHQPQQQQQHQQQQQQYHHQQQQQHQSYQQSAVTKHVTAPETRPAAPSTGGLPPGQNICAECERLIVGVFVRIKDKNLHAECFKCATCGSSLKNQGYFNINNKLYCDVHAKMAALSHPPPGAQGLRPIPISPDQKLGANTISAALNARVANNMNGSPQLISNNMSSYSPTHSRTSSSTSSSCNSLILSNSSNNNSNKTTPTQSTKSSPIHSREGSLTTPMSSSSSSSSPCNFLKKQNDLNTFYNNKYITESKIKDNLNFDAMDCCINGKNEDEPIYGSIQSNLMKKPQEEFLFKTLNGGTIRSVKPPGRGVDVDYKVNNSYTAPKPYNYSQPPAAAPKSPSSYPPSAPWAQPKPASNYGGPTNNYGSLPRQNGGQGGQENMYSEEICEILPEETKTDNSTLTPFANWPPQKDEDRCTPTASPLYIPPPGTQHVQAKPISKDQIPDISKNTRVSCSAPELTSMSLKNSQSLNDIESSSESYTSTCTTTTTSYDDPRNYQTMPTYIDQSYSDMDLQDYEIAAMQHYKMSLCSAEVNEINGRRSAQECAEFLSDSINTNLLLETIKENSPRPPSPPPKPPKKVEFSMPLEKKAQAVSHSSQTADDKSGTALIDLHSDINLAQLEAELLIPELKALPPTHIKNPTPQEYQSELLKALYCNPEKQYRSVTTPTIEVEDTTRDSNNIKVVCESVCMQREIEECQKKCDNTICEEVCVKKATKNKNSATPVIEVKRTNEIMLDEKNAKKGSFMASLLTTAPSAPVEFVPKYSNEPVPLPEETEPYIPPPMSMKPIIREDVTLRAQSPFVRALITAPAEPYNAFEKDVTSQLDDLPTPKEKLTMMAALTVAPDRPFTPVAYNAETTYTCSVSSVQTKDYRLEQYSADNHCSEEQAIVPPPPPPPPMPTQMYEGKNGIEILPGVRSVAPPQPPMPAQAYEEKNVSAFANVAGVRSVNPFKPCREHINIYGISPKGFSLASEPKEPSMFDSNQKYKTSSEFMPKIESKNEKEIVDNLDNEVNTISMDPNPAPVSQPKPHYEYKSLHTGLHKPDAIPSYQKDLLKCPIQTPTRPPESPQLRENIPIAFLDTPSSELHKPVAVSAASMTYATSSSTTQSKLPHEQHHHQNINQIHQQSQSIQNNTLSFNEQRSGPITMTFQPLDDLHGAQSPHRPFTPSLINKPAPTIPYYQKNLCPIKCDATEAHIFDPKSRSPSPHPERAKSPAPGPPPNPLRAQCPKLKDPVKKDNSKLVPSMQQQQQQQKIAFDEKPRSLIGFKKLDISIDDKNSENYKIMDKSSAKSFYETPEIVQQKQIGNINVQTKSKGSQLNEQNRSEMQSATTTNIGNKQIQRRTRVVEEFEHSKSEKSVEILKTSGDIRRASTDVNGQPRRGFVANQTRRLSGVNQEETCKVAQWNKNVQDSQSTHKTKQLTLKSCDEPLKSNEGTRSFPVSPDLSQPLTHFPTVSYLSAKVKAEENLPSTLLRHNPMLSLVPTYEPKKPKSILSGTNTTNASSIASSKVTEGKLINQSNSLNQSSALTKTSNIVVPKPQSAIPVTPNKQTNSTANEFKKINQTIPAYKPNPSSGSGFKQPQKIPSAVVSDPSPASAGPAKGGAFGSTSAPRRGRGTLNKAVGPGVRVPLCGCCNTQIRGPFITALGRIWCPDHFICTTANCRRPLQDIGFVEEKGQLYCEFCFEKYFAPACSKCSGKIMGDCLNAIGRHFHPECFTCTYCGKLFGNSPFFLEEGEPYCQADWNELFTTKCYACGFPVEAGDRWVEALNNNYHSQCFNCSMCKKNLEGQSFFAKGGRPFCKNHAR